MRKLYPYKYSKPGFKSRHMEQNNGIFNFIFVTGVQLQRAGGTERAKWVRQHSALNEDANAHVHRYTCRSSYRVIVKIVPSK